MLPTLPLLAVVATQQSYLPGKALPLQTLFGNKCSPVMKAKAARVFLSVVFWEMSVGGDLSRVNALPYPDLENSKTY